MKVINITEKSQQVYRFIQYEFAKTTIYPSTREIAEEFGFSQTMAVNHLKALNEYGLLSNPKQGCARSYALPILVATEILNKREFFAP